MPSIPCWLNPTDTWNCLRASKLWPKTPGRITASSIKIPCLPRTGSGTRPGPVWMRVRRQPSLASRKGFSTMKRDNPYLFLVPAVAFVALAELVPAVYTIYLGFMKWDIITPPQWVGFANYFRVFSTPELLNALKNTVLWVVGTLMLPVGLALIIATLLDSIECKTIFKAIFFIPSTLSPTVAAIFWRRVLASQQGSLNAIIAALGFAPISFLTEPQINTFVMIGVWTWQFFGLNLILFLVGLETIPTELREAARIDGANAWQMFSRVTVPLLRPITLVVIANAAINSVRMFDIPWVMIQGGPGRTSETLAISLYRESFLLFRMGLGSAIAVVISLFALALSLRYLLAIRQERR
ncbi:ABC transporter permease subunit [candidate division KSB3 bacterium]|uniref:ABC transporter permease subunit n=1 Tax=candidate division KSB3 bacterium TaxID=2044937 RepID=A0A9D5Q5S3_9BACT|nr:ABC transporter permease subunit [candidate division KSB3 bacterium]MBD3324930.1 ABC transporter permease subunit [candidate division KSB3 bacterium]